jgi:hypothetical protein
VAGGSGTRVFFTYSATSRACHHTCDCHAKKLTIAPPLHRRIEWRRRQLRELVRGQPSPIACGGGRPCIDANGVESHRDPRPRYAETDTAHLGGGGQRVPARVCGYIST